MTSYKGKHLATEFNLRPAEFNYIADGALIALSPCRVSAVSQTLNLIYWPASSARTNITCPQQQ